MLQTFDILCLTASGQVTGATFSHFNVIGGTDANFRVIQPPLSQGTDSVEQ